MLNLRRGRRDCMVVRLTTTCIQSVPITTYFVSSVIKSVSDFRQVSDFLFVLQFSPPTNTDSHAITEILLNTILMIRKKELLDLCSKILHYIVIITQNLWMPVFCWHELLQMNCIIYIYLLILKMFCLQGSILIKCIRN